MTIMAEFHPQFIKAGNEELVVITRAEFDQLMAIASREAEEADDVDVFDALMAELKVGTDAALPAEVTGYMLGGDGLLTAVRRWRGITREALSARTGVAHGVLGDIEAGRATGHPEELRRIADALTVDVAWLR